jgi:hypothetical protein
MFSQAVHPWHNNGNDIFEIISRTYGDNVLVRNIVNGF